jgi:hypothetical protein
MYKRDKSLALAGNQTLAVQSVAIPTEISKTVKTTTTTKTPTACKTVA